MLDAAIWVALSSEIWAKIIHVSSEQSIQELVYGDFPEGPVVKTSPSNAKGEGSVPDWEAKTLHASSPKNQSVKQKQYCNKFSKDFKNGPHPKKFLKKKKLSTTLSPRETEMSSQLPTCMGHEAGLRNKCLMWYTT